MCRLLCFEPEHGGQLLHIPLADELMDMVGKKHTGVFLSLDLMKGCHQA